MHESENAKSHQSGATGPTPRANPPVSRPWGVLLLALLGLAGTLALALAVVSMRGDVRTSLFGIRLSLASPLRPALVASACFAVGCVGVLLAPSSKWLRRGTVLALVVSSSVLAASWVRALPATASIGDGAAMSLRTLRMLEGNQLTGMYSRMGWDHPGPAVFAVLAPLYAATGHHEASHSVTAIIVNALALLGLFWCVRGARAQLALAAALALFVLRVPGLGASAWTPHILVFPLMLYIALAARLATGERARLPALVLLGSALAQTHVGVSVCVAGVLGMAVTLAATRAGHADGRSAGWSRPLNLAAWAALAAWFLPLAEQVTSPDGNLGRLASFLVSPGGEHVSLGDATSAFASQFVGVLLPGFHLALGWSVEVMHARLAVAATVCLFGALAVIAIRSPRDSGRGTGSLAVVTLTGAILGLWSITRITGGLADHLVFWVSGLGVLALACVLAAAAEAVPVFRTGGWDHLPRVAMIGVVLTLVGVGVIQVQSARDTYSPFVRSFHRVMHEHMQRQLVTRPVVGATPGRWAEAAGAVLLFRKAGETVGVTKDLDGIVGDRRALEQPEMEFVLAGAAEREQMLKAGGWTRLRTLTPDIDVLARPWAVQGVP